MNELNRGLDPVAKATGTAPTIDELRARRGRRKGRRAALTSASALSILVVIGVVAAIASSGPKPSNVRTEDRGTTATIDSATTSGTHHLPHDDHPGDTSDSTTSTTAVTVPGTADTTDSQPTSSFVSPPSIPGVAAIGVATVGPTIVGTGFWGTESTGLTGGKGSAVVTWSAPVYDSGLPITGYFVEGTYVGGEPSVSCRVGADATSCLVKGIYADQPITFQVIAYNALGNGPPSASSNAITTPETVPNVPTIDVPRIGDPDRATAGDASATMTWGEPFYDGGSPVTGYIVESYLPDGSAAGHACSTGASARSCTVTGLTNGTTYTFRVRAINALGTGDQSIASNAVTPSATQP